VHTTKTLFLLLNSLLHILILPPCLFSFTFSFFDHSELFLSHLHQVAIFIHIPTVISTEFTQFCRPVENTELHLEHES
jgi:hypothetical protein